MDVSSGIPHAPHAPDPHAPDPHAREPHAPDPRALERAHADLSARLHADLAARLHEAGHLLTGPVPGAAARGAGFAAVVEAVAALAVGRAAARGPHRVLRFPPVFPREHFEKTDYLASFPDLTGSVHTFRGADAEHAALLADRAAGRPWDRHLSPSDSVLTPACCHPAYPLFTGELCDDEVTLDVRGWAFRHEPSRDPLRLQSFQMQEFVRIGTPSSADRHRSEWVGEASALLSDLGLEPVAVPASDPFFGRAGRLLAAEQVHSGLKTELVVAVYGPGLPATALASANSHRDHFGSAFDIRTPDGATAHSACVGFGLERTAIALFARHGMEVPGWPAAVRGVLGL